MDGKSDTTVPEPVMILAKALDYSPSLYLAGPSRAVIEQAAKLWEELKAKGYCKDA